VSSVTTIEPVSAKWEAFGWTAIEVDGHDTAGLIDALDAPTDKPKVIVARTTATATLQALGELDDAHFITIDDELRRSMRDELAGRL
jgi:transketolase